MPSVVRGVSVVGRWLLPFTLLLLVAPGVHGQPLPAGPGDSRYSLPKGTNPRQFALASDGAAWVINDFSGVTRLGPTGGTQEFLESEEDDLDDIAAGPNGSVWVAASGGVLQIDPAGRVTRPSTNAAASAVAPTRVGDPGIWLADAESDSRGSIVRMSADGTSREFPYRAPRDAFAVNGIVQAPDGSVWFTEGGIHHHSWIGRMTAAGAVVHWPLPRSVGEPGRIAAGSDGAMWFTGRHAIARIASNGQVTSFRLGGGAAPHDIVAGTDSAMWFTSDACVGRVTSAGAMTTWPLAGAMRLERIAAAGDGSFWLMDRVGNAIHHVNPSAAAPAPCGAPTLTREAGPTSATLAFQRYEDDFFGDLHVHIARRGQELFSEAVPRVDRAEARTGSKWLTVSDLDGDGEPEVMLTANWSGTQCCSWTRFYRYDRARNTYLVHQRFWGYYGAEPVLRDLDGDRRPELLSLDDRFSERFTHSFVRPPRIWSYRAGKLRDVTRRYPRLVRKDAAELWRAYVKDRKTGARTLLPPWMADQYLLGRQAYADRVLEQAAARGELKHSYGYKPRSPRAFVAAVEAFLHARYRR